MRRGARDYIQKPWDNQRLLQTLRTQIELGQALRRSRRLEHETSRLRSQRAARAGRRVAGHAAGAAADGAGRAVRRQRADHRRARHRQGGGRALAARRLAARGPPVRGGERRRRQRGRLRERAVRPREGRLHRRQGRPGRLLRAGRRRHAVPRRDRQHAAEPAGQAAARAADRRVPPGGLVAGAPGRRARPRGHQRRRRARRWPRAASARICSTGSTPSRSTCRRCASGARTSRRWPPTSRRAWPRATASPRRGFSPDAMQALLEHPWPGNVRELEHVVERAAAAGPGRRRRARGPGAARPGARDGGSARLEQHDPGGGGAPPDPAGAGPRRRQGQRGRQGAGAVAQRALPPAAAPRAQEAANDRAGSRHHATRGGCSLLALLSPLPAVALALGLLWPAGTRRARCSWTLHAGGRGGPGWAARFGPARAGGARAADHRQPAGGAARGRLLHPRRRRATRATPSARRCSRSTALADTLRASGPARSRPARCWPR